MKETENHEFPVLLDVTASHPQTFNPLIVDAKGSVSGIQRVKEGIDREQPMRGCSCTPGPVNAISCPTRQAVSAYRCADVATRLDDKTANLVGSRTSAGFLHFLVTFYYLPFFLSLLHHTTEQPVF
jgi:hypothetical protein